MLYWLLSAWITGFVGSAHCVGMCGPLALSLPFNEDKPIKKIFDSLVYNIGRVTTYAVYGTVAGLLHVVMVPEKFQNLFSIIAGVVLIALGFVTFFTSKIRYVNASNNFFYKKIISWYGFFYSKKKLTALYILGILNGILPCGLVYLALASAFAAHSILHSTLYMVFFGLGTLPAMWGIVFLANYITPSIRMKLRKAYPFIFLISGLLLIARGIDRPFDFLPEVLMACKKIIH